MYLDALTATGVYASILIVTALLYLQNKSYEQ
jgi:hypothetical protein